MPARAGRGRTPGPLALLFFASGAAGLVHEVAWARALGQSLGSSLQSLTAVLVAFLGGMAIGAELGSRRAVRGRSPLGDYAALESFLGVYGLLSPLVAALLMPALEILGPAFAPGAPLAVLRLMLALAALLPATIAMGATFPLIVRAGAGRGAAAGNTVAFLYGVNTLGAALGAMAGSFALLPLLGTRGTFLVAGGTNLLVGITAFARAKHRPEAGTGSMLAAPATGLRTRGTAQTALLAAALTGVSGALLQVGWTRVASLVFGSSVYALGLTLAAYVLGLGAGPFLVRRRLGRDDADPGATAAAAQATVAAASLVLLPVFGGLPILAARISGRLGAQPILMVVAQFVVLLLLLLAPTLAQGASLPALIAFAGEPRGSAAAAGHVYAASSLGSVLGFLLAGFVALPRLGTRKTLVAASLLALFTAAALSAVRARQRDGAGRSHRGLVRVIAGGAMLLVAVPVMVTALPAWDPRLMSGGGFLYGPVYRAASGSGRVREAMRRRGAIIYEEDSGEGLVTVRRSPIGTLSLQINGKTEASTGGDMGTQLLAAHLPLLLRQKATTVLVIGLASGITLGAAERHPVTRIEVIEIAPAVVGAARLFEAENGRALDDPRVALVIDDARGRLLARRERYDVITSQPSNPWVAGVSNLFTREFYRLVREHLRPGGIFCQWIQAYRLAPDDLRGVVRSFLEIFPEATLWEESAGGGDYFLVGTDGPLQVNAARFDSPDSAAAWVDLRRAGIDSPADLLARFVTGPGGLKQFADGRAPLTDDNLYLEWSAPLALFRDSIREQVRAIGPYRESPFALLPADGASPAPDLVAALRDRLRIRSERLSILESLRDADMLGLVDPGLAAGIEALRTGLYLEAARVLSRVAPESGQEATASLLLAEAYRAAGLDAAAAVAFREALARDSRLAPAWNGLGRCLAARGLDDEARAAFERAIATDPGLASARNNLGSIFLRAGRLEAAERAFRNALAIDPSLAAARANLGLALKRRGDREGAERAYRASLDLDPLNTDARFNLAELLASDGRAEEARRQIDELLRIDPGDEIARLARRRLQGARSPTPPNTRTGS